MFFTYFRSLPHFLYFHEWTIFDAIFLHYLVALALGLHTRFFFFLNKHRQENLIKNMNFECNLIIFTFSAHVYYLIYVKIAKCVQFRARGRSKPWKLSKARRTHEELTLEISSSDDCSHFNNFFALSQMGIGLVT